MQLSSNCKSIVVTTSSNKKWARRFTYNNDGVSLVRLIEFEYICVTLPTNLKLHSISEQYNIFEAIGTSDTRLATKQKDAD